MTSGGGGGSDDCIASVTAYMRSENAVLAVGEEGWNQGKDLWRETINFWEGVYRGVNC